MSRINWPNEACAQTDGSITTYIHSTVNVRIPNVRFAKPDENMSGFRIVRISNVRFTTNRPDFRHIVQPDCPITGRRNPDKCVRLSDVRAIESTKTGLEPVRMIGTGHLKSGHCKVNEPDVRNPDNIVRLTDVV